MKKYFVWTTFFLLLLLMFLPSYMGAKFAENANAAKGYLRVLYEANEMYRKIHRPAEYAATLQELAQDKLDLADVEHMQTEKHGYLITYERKNGDYFAITAHPVTPFLTGYQSFFIDQTGVIRLKNSEGDPIDA